MSNEITEYKKNQLSEIEQNKVKELKEAIDIKDTNSIISFGAAAQRKTSEFVDSILDSIKTKDAGDAGETLTTLMKSIKGFDTDTQPKGFLSRLISPIKNKAEKLQNSYRSVEANIDKIVDSLEKHRMQLMQNNSMLDKLYEKNLEYLEDLKLYIVAGEDKVQELTANVLPALKAKAQESNDQLPAQIYKDTLDSLDRIEKKAHDLKLTRTVSLQILPQIRLQQSTNNVLIDKIHSSVVNSIPLWKSQMVIALGLTQTGDALRAQKAVTDTTNELLRKNSEMLKQTTLETARESERSIVDIQTISKANQDIISTIQEVVKIQKDGREKRLEAEKELTRIEAELKNSIINALESK